MPLRRQSPRLAASNTAGGARGSRTPSEEYQVFGASRPRPNHAARRAYLICLTLERKPCYSIANAKSSVTSGSRTPPPSKRGFLMRRGQVLASVLLLASCPVHPPEVASQTEQKTRADVDLDQACRYFRDQDDPGRVATWSKGCSRLLRNWISFPP